MNQAFNGSGWLHHIYPYTGDYMFPREIAVGMCNNAILKQLYLDFAGQVPDPGRFDLKTLSNIMVWDGYCPRLRSNHHGEWMTISKGIHLVVAHKNHWLDICIDYGKDKHATFMIEKGTPEMVAEFLSALLESFDNIVSFVYKKHDIEQFRYKIAKVAQASGCGFLPEGMSCVVMPDEDGMYQVALWHCGSIYEKVSVSEKALADMKSILAGMHVKSGTLK